jgi:hypothetical protein
MALKVKDEQNLIKEGLAAMKSGYRDEKEEMSGKNVEVLVVGAQGVKILSI